MKDKLRIDSHKLIFHPERVARWLKGENIPPLYMEIGPIGRCPHRCIYCAFDYLNYQGPILQSDILKQTLTDATNQGLKSIMFAGEGEPLMHPDISQLSKFAFSLGLDIAISTNGLLFEEELANECLPALSWIRFSLDAATTKTYTKIHRCQPQDFHKVLQNIQRATAQREFHSCIISIQALLLPQNKKEMVALASLARELGADNLAIKPFSKHPLSFHDFDADYSDYQSLQQELEAFKTDNFSVIFRSHAICKITEDEKPYQECLGLPFTTYIDSSGDVYACSSFLGNKDFIYGNIYQYTFSEIWEGQARKEVLRRVSEMGVASCRKACRLDEINRYLWELKYPHQHVNFI